MSIIKGVKAIGEFKRVDRRKRWGKGWSSKALGVLVHETQR